MATNGLILIVDPHRETREMYGDYFRYHGYAVAEAATSPEALFLAAELEPELVVTELSDEPEWLAAVRAIRRPGRSRPPAVIACSNSIDRRWPGAPPGVDVDRALPKPTSPRALLQVVRQLLGAGTMDAALLAL